MAITVDAILKLPIFETTKLLGGSQGIDREVSSANIAGSPDVGNWLRPNQLLLTTGYHFKDDPEGLIPFIHKLNQNQCSGLAIKTKRYIDTLPDHLIHEADLLNFPLIELPNNMLLGDVIIQILENVLNENQLELQKTFEVHTRFSNLFLKGASMSDIAQTLASLIKGSVLILNSIYEPVGISESLKRQIKTAGYLESIKTALKAASFQENSLTAISWDRNKSADIYPVYVSGIHKGFICVIDAASRSLHPSYTMPLEQASQIVAYETMKQDALVEGEKRLRRQFFSDWLDNRLSKEEVMNRVKTYPIVDQESYLICVCAADPSPEGHLLTDLEQNARCERWLFQTEKFLQAYPRQAICEIKDKGLILILPMLSDSNKSFDEKEYVEIFRNLQQRLIEENQMTTFSIGVSNPVDQISKIPQAFLEAKQTLEIGYSLQKKQFIHTYRTQQVTELIQSIPDNKLHDFYSYCLGELAFSDQPERQELLNTLNVFLNNESSIAETAKVMFLHRNTVQNRINRCESLLNISVKDPIDTLKIRIALVIHRLIK
jgi:purine catabolism regulator